MCIRDRHLLTNYEKQSEVKVIEADNIGAFYNYVSKRTTYRSGIGALLDNDGDIVTDDKAKAELLNEYFASVGTVDNGVQPVCTDSINCIKSLDTVELSTLDVAIVMSKLKSSLSSGPDGLPPILFKN